MSLSRKKIAVLGGGTGVFTVLTGLKRYFSHLTAIVTMADDGGSTGKLREEFGILPPGDIRRSLIALSSSDDKILSDLFSYRFTEGKGLAGHSFGNLMLAALERITGSFEEAVDAAAKILSVEGEVIPVTLDNIRLNALLEDGAVVVGEGKIDRPIGGRSRIAHIWLEPLAQINPRARRSLLEADAIIIGPGDLYTSLLPNLLVAGVSEALRGTRAKVIYIVNVMTKRGETDGFRASDFLSGLEEYLGKNVIDTILVNDQHPTPARLKPYLAEGAALVEADIASETQPQVVNADLIRSEGFVRHDPGKLARAIKKILD
jgi:uncharacterized cofD-like protein